MEFENVVEIEVEAEQGGRQGLSAYELYLNNGGALSETEWLASLKGEKGDKGDTGEKGETGGVSLEELKAITGELEGLSTEDKTNLVNAINEVFNNTSSEGSSYIPFENLGTVQSVTLNSYGTYFLDYPMDNVNITVRCNAEGTNYSRTVKGGGVLIYMPTNVNGQKAKGILLHIGWSGWYYFHATVQHYSSATLFTPGLLDVINKEQTITAKKTFNVLPESSVTPTSNNQLVNKKYVDDKVASSGGSGGSSSVNYSTEEQVIGTWIDGKIIYRKVIQTQTPNSESINQWTVVSSITNMDTLVNMYGFFIARDGRKVTINHGENGAQAITTFIDGNIETKIAYSYWSDLPMYIVIEYTKATD